MKKSIMFLSIVFLISVLFSACSLSLRDIDTETLSTNTETQKKPEANEETEEETETEEEVEMPAFDIWEGEAAVGNAAHLAYPMIDGQNDVTKIEVWNESGSFSFSQIWDEADAKYVWRMEEYKDVPINSSAFEMLRMHLSAATTKTPMRNVSEKDMQEWGVDSSCKNGYTIYYNDNGVTKSHTVRIGKEANESGGTYCAYIEGRNHIYKFSKEACEYVFRPLTSYLNPTITTFFANEIDAIFGIDKFEIYLERDSAFSSIVEINVNQRDGSTVNFNATFYESVLDKKLTAVASNEYLIDVFSILYIAFSVEETVAIDPDEEALKKYGLGASDEKYLIDVEFSETASFVNPYVKAKDAMLYMSREIDGHRYILTKYYEKDMIVKVDNEMLSFLEADANSLSDWINKKIATNGFYEYICKDEETGAPGLNKIIVKSYKNEDEKTFNEEIFNLFYDEANDSLLVKAENSGLEFLDNKEAQSSYDVNWFRNLYVYFLYFPSIDSFNTMTDAELSVCEKDENIAYSITAYRNDGKVVRYTYYKIDVNLAFEKAESGTVADDGTITWGEPVYDYTASMTYIRKVCKAIDILLSGEKVTPEDII